MDPSRRLMKEFQNILKDPPPGITASPTEGNIFEWNAVIVGVDETLWEDAVLKVKMKYPKDYPAHPPFCTFITKVFHPNVFPTTQEICLDILRRNWSPAYNVSAILLSIQQLLTEPNPAANANPEACQLYIHNRSEYEHRVRQCVEDSWVQD